jgi:hypothetical protein
MTAKIVQMIDKLDVWFANAQVPQLRSLHHRQVASADRHHSQYSAVSWR